MKKKTEAFDKEHQEINGKKSHIPFRLNILFFIIFVLFVSLIVKLGYMQIVQSSWYEGKLEESTASIVRTPSARGQIYDAKGVPLVSNIAKQSITYTRGRNVSAESMKETAIKLASLVNIKPQNLTKRDKVDFYLATPKNFQKIYEKRLSDFDVKDSNGVELDQGTIYQKVVEKVTSEEYNDFGKNGKSAVYIFKKMNNAAEFNTVTISSDDISTKDIAKVGEHESELDGIGTGTAWDRRYNKDSGLLDILGGVSTEQAGLPAEKLDEYLKQGYARNDRVGTSQLEEQYERVLQGKPQESEIEMNQNGELIKQEVKKQGEKGDNIKLTVDVEFQKKVEGIMKKYFTQALTQSTKQATNIGEYSPGAYVVVMNPNTGAVLSMVGLDYKEGKLVSNPASTIWSFTEPGSVVKGATLTAGYETGVIQGNEILLDHPFKIKGTKIKGSVFNPTGSNNMYLSAKQALEYSSNDYMMSVTMKMLGLNYYEDMTLPETNKDKVYKELRTAYAQYGMGIKTGIDLPNESIGIIGETTGSDAMGKLLDLSFGQYDNYTALQLANYASTVANGGKRVVPHLVQGIYGNNETGGLGKMVRKTETKVANKVPISKSEMSLIQDGFYNVVHGTNLGLTTGRPLANAKMSISAKTGTAEKVLPDGTLGVNSNIVAYAPSDKPQVALGLLFPGLKDYHGEQNMNMTRDIINLYYEMYYSKGKKP